MIIHPENLSPTLLGRIITIQHEGTVVTGKLTKLALNVTLGSTPGQSVKSRIWNDSYVKLNTITVHLGPHDTINVEDD